MEGERRRRRRPQAIAQESETPAVQEAGQEAAPPPRRRGEAQHIQIEYAPQKQQRHDAACKAKQLCRGAVERIGRAWRGIKGKLPARQIAMVVLICIALVSAYQAGSIALRSVRTRQLNEELAQYRMENSAEEIPEPAEQQELNELLTADETEETDAVQEQPVFAEADAQPAAGVQAQDTVVSTRFHQVGGEALPEMVALYEKNRDLVAWIEIADVLDLPVVYRDNTYYLTHDFNKQKSASGTIFLDENHPFREKTQNLLLHGHNMKDGTMFGRLAQYLHDKTYIKNHPFISFDTLWKKEQYVIFAVLSVSLDVKNPQFFNYFTHDTFASDVEFSAYVRQLQLRSSIAIPVDVQPGDALLTLSTCLDENRLVIVARRLRDGETRSELRRLVNTATRQ